jgi:hypothetical protein
MKVTAVIHDDTGMVSNKHARGEKFNFTKLAMYVNVKPATGSRKILRWFQAKKGLNCHKIKIWHLPKRHGTPYFQQDKELHCLIIQDKTCYM